jgi:glycosyltransferase involved in cell wall biosynthesis
MSKSKKLFIGITSFDSAVFLGSTIKAAQRNTDPDLTRIVVLDNESTDGSAELARDYGVEVVSQHCTQPQALNHLLDLSRSEFTLLIHSDVILLSPRWFEVCSRRLTGNVALISPEDIGCGPFTRPWGKNKPESSFLLFRTAMARAARTWHRVQRFKIRWPYRALDFFGDHVTYNLPEVLATHGYAWTMMSVHTSSYEERAVYQPNFKPKIWRDTLSFYRYGLGNFYSLDGHMTHYHNWFDRTISESVKLDVESQETFPKKDGLPLAYVKAYTEKFLSDYKNDAVIIPEVSSERRESYLDD